MISPRNFFDAPYFRTLFEMKMQIRVLALALSILTVNPSLGCEIPGFNAERTKVLSSDYGNETHSAVWEYLHSFSKALLAKDGRETTIRSEYTVADNNPVAVTQTVSFHRGCMAVINNGDKGSVEYPGVENIVTRDGSIYMWPPGEKSGIYFPASIEDSVAYYLYVIDPAGLRYGSYQWAFEEPQIWKQSRTGDLSFFEHRAGGDLVQLFVRKINSGLVWMNKFVYQFGAVNYTATISLPTEVSLPIDEHFQVPDDVTFKFQPEMTIRAHMGSL